MQQLIKHFLKKEKGVSTIEFTLTFFIFSMVLIVFFDLAFLVMASAELDYVVAASTKHAKNEIVNMDDVAGSYQRYKDAQKAQALLLANNIIGSSNLLSITLGGKVDVNVCRAQNYSDIIAQLQFMTQYPNGKPTGVSDKRQYCSDDSIDTSTGYFPYAVYQYRVLYKPLISFIPLYGNYQQQLLTRRYVALQEWSKTPPVTASSGGTQ